MKAIIDLTPNYHPIPNTEEYQDTWIAVNSFIFPGGEPHAQVELIDSTESEEDYPFNEIKITMKVKSFNDLGRLISVVDALRHSQFKDLELKLILPYFPGARQDRKVEGEEFGVKLYADIINNLKFSSVTILDPHSEVTPALIDNVYVIDNHGFIAFVVQDIKKRTGRFPILVSPDAGSSKKMYDLLSGLNRRFDGFPNLIYQGTKHRDMTTGKLSGFSIDMDRENDVRTPLLIVDDICDGGGTFIGLAEVILPKLSVDKNLFLAVTHGIFSKGFEKLLIPFKKLYSTDSFIDSNEDIGHIVTIFKQELI